MSGKVIQNEKSLSQLRQHYSDKKKKKKKVIYNSPESGKHCLVPSQAGTNVSYSLLCKSAREMQGWKQHKIIHGVNSPTQCGQPRGLFLLCVLVGGLFIDLLFNLPESNILFSHITVGGLWGLLRPKSLNRTSDRRAVKGFWFQRPPSFKRNSKV